MSQSQNSLVTLERKTKETEISIKFGLTPGEISIDIGLPFFDHMLSQLAKHSSSCLKLKAIGDLEVDAHHTVEDTGILLGEALKTAIGDKTGIVRFASVSLPLDEALIDVALDISGRPYLGYFINFDPDTQFLGSPGFDPQLAEEFFRAFVTSSQITLHINLKYGKNIHHILEATFKGVAVCLKRAIEKSGNQIPSTKGVL